MRLISSNSQLFHNWMGRSLDVALEAGDARERSQLRDCRTDQRTRRMQTRG
jgi:hypothetical protein